MVLRDVTSHATDLPAYPEAVPVEPVTAAEGPDSLAVDLAPPLPADVEVAPAPSPAAHTPEVRARGGGGARGGQQSRKLRPELERAIAFSPAPEPVPQVAWEPEPVVVKSEPEPVLAIDADPWPRDDEPTEAENHDSEEVAVSLIWPEDTPLKEIADLSWPVQSEDGERGGPTDIDVVPGPLISFVAAGVRRPGSTPTMRRPRPGLNGTTHRAPPTAGLPRRRQPSWSRKSPLTPEPVSPSLSPEKQPMV